MASRWQLTSVAVLAVSAAVATVARADIDANELGRRSRVIVRAGERTFTVGELESVLAVIPRFQLRDRFGTDADTIRHKAVNEIVLPELLLTNGAEDRKLDQQPDVARRLLLARGEATEKALQKTLGIAASIPMSEVKTFYDAHKDKFDAPSKIGLWRILCASADEAKQVLAEAQRDGEPKHYGTLAREHSRDMATRDKGGDLGLVGPDGASSEAGLKVDPALYFAASKVKDGQFVPDPVPEAGMFAVVWRRGALAEHHLSVEQAAGQIRDELWKEKYQDALKKLEADLRAKHVRDEDDALLDGLEIEDDTAAILGGRRPGQSAPITNIGRRNPPAPMMPVPSASSGALIPRPQAPH